MTISDGLKKLTTLASTRPDPPAGRLQELDRDRVAERRRSRHVLGGHAAVLRRARSSSRPLRSSRAASSPWRAERRAARQRLEAAHVAAPADDRRVVDDLDVPDVARRDPWAPRWSRPSEMIPAPIPVPILTTTTLSWPCAMPDRHSPRASTLTSLSTQTGARVARREALPDRVAVPAGHDRRRDRAAGPRTRPGPGRRCRRPTAARGRRGSSAASSPNSSSTRPRTTLRAARDVRGLVVVPEDPPVEVGDRDVDARRPEVRDQHVAGVARGRRGGGAAGRRCSGRCRPRRPGRARSARRRAGRRSPGRGPSGRPARDRDRDRPRRISSRTTTSASSASSGTGPGLASSCAGSASVPLDPSIARIIRVAHADIAGPHATFALDKQSTMGAARPSCVRRAVPILTRSDSAAVRSRSHLDGLDQSRLGSRSCP